MSVHEINGGPSPLSPVRKGRAVLDATDATLPGDKAQLSSEARSLLAAEKARQIEEIRARLESGYYSSPEVTAVIVDGLLEDLRAPGD